MKNKTLLHILVFSALFFVLKNRVALGQSKELPTMKHITNIEGNLSPKSVVHNGNGLFFAQNMMYRHTVTVYNRNYELVKVIKDEVELNKYGYSNYKGKFKGAPVECAFSHNGKYAWVSNYQMSGGDSTQFKKPGCDGCSSKDKYDSSFVYKINTSNLEIEKVIKVGAVPKYVYTTPDNSKVLVTNWTSGDLSIIDTEKNIEIKRIKLGTYPRGIVTNSKSTFAYIAVMGSNSVAKVNLQTFEVQHFNSIGKTPRHLCISSDDQFLYISFNGEGMIGKLNLVTQEMVKLRVGNQPRSMVLSNDNKSLFVVNYADNTFSKISTSTMTVAAKTKTKHHPIGITFDKEKQAVWVACYSGYLQIFKDSLIQPQDLLLATKSSKKKNADLKNEPKKEELIVAKVLEPKKVPVIVIKPPPSPYRDKPKEKITVKVDAPKEKPVLTAGEKKEKKPTVSKPEISTLKEVKPVGNFYVIAGAFSIAKNAEKLAIEFQSKGYESFIYFNPNKGMTYCVVQSFESQDLASKCLNELTAKGTSSWVFVKE
jgi:YVTN family beta-propeller protein